MISISAVSLGQTDVEIGCGTESGHRSFVNLATVHGVTECQRDPESRYIYNASGSTTADGMRLFCLR